MKHIKLLLIISITLIIISCENEKNEITNKQITNITAPNDTLVKLNKAINTIVVPLEKDSTNLVKKDNVIKKKLNKKLEVEIDGEIYYKKHKNDERVKIGFNKTNYHKTHYYNKEKNRYYDIITGKSVYIYGKHGKVIKEK